MDWRTAGTEAWRAAAAWDRVDETATAAIRANTTEARFLTPMVSYLPEDPAVPSPRDVLGYVVGTEGKLTRPDDEIRYFRVLADASPRVRLLEAGTTDEGRTMHLVVVTSEANMRRLDELRGYTAALADPGELDEAAAQAMIGRALPIVHLTAGLHSPETGSPEMVMELAYRLAVSKHPDIVRIRDNVVTLITPILEVDGRARQVDWYYRHLEEFGDRLDMPPLSPPYWGHYTFHDNNRDGIQLSQKLTRNYLKTFFDWHPTYSLDLHESVPYLYVSIGTGPYNTALDPIVITEWQWIASWEVSRLQAQGLPGVWTWGFYTGWNPSYLLWITNNHNSLGRFYETFGNSSARTMERDLSDNKYSGKDVTEREWYRSVPPDKKVLWSMRNNTNYMESGVLETLKLASQNGATLLENFWKKGVNSIERGRRETPHAWVIRAAQRDRGRLAYLVNQLRRQGIEVHEATRPFTLSAAGKGAGSGQAGAAKAEGKADRRTGPVESAGKTKAGTAREAEDGAAESAGSGALQVQVGDFVVRLDQPYGNLARNLLSIQTFPKDAEHRPYDDVSWTLGLLYGVETIAVDEPAILKAEGLRLLESDIAPAGRFGSGSGKGKTAVWAIGNTGQNGLVTARYRLAGFEVLAAEKEFESGGRTYPAGSWLIEPQSGLDEALRGLARDLALDIVSLDRKPAVRTHPLDPPRLALYHNWISTQDDGWCRYTLEQAGVPYDYINDDDIRAGGLRARYDVIMMANQWDDDPRDLVHGIDPKFGPVAWTRTDEFPSHGVIDSSDDITGGIGFEGLANMEKFLDDGGTLLLFGSAGRLATDFGLLRHVGTLQAGEVGTPGSSLRARVMRTDHPIAYGYEEKTSVYRVDAPVYTVPKQFEHWIVVQYGTKDIPGDEADSSAGGRAGPTGGTAAGGGGMGGSEAAAKPGSDSTDGKEDLLLSGFVSGAKDLDRKGVILDVPRRRGGRVILYSFDPMHRYLNHADHNWVYNAILNWNDMPDPSVPGHPGLAKD